MLIEHTTKRHNGSVHTIAGVKYHFAPNDAGAHVAEVQDPAHIQRFLSIPSFAVYSDEPQPKAPAADAPRQEMPLEADAPAAVGTPLEEAPDEVLDELYQKAFGKKPHHKIKREKTIEAIRASMAKAAE
jgi:hypothetical protein